MSYELQRAIDRLQKEVSLCYQVRANLEASSPDVARHDLQERLVREPERRKLIDEACRYWISDDKWPLMDDQDALVISDRLAEGLLLAKWLKLHGFSAPDKNEYDLLNFLLVENWEAVSIHRLRARLVEKLF